MKDMGKFVVEKLNGKNHLTWTAQYEALIQAESLWDYGDRDLLMSTGTNRRYKEAVMA